MRTKTKVKFLISVLGTFFFTVALLVFIDLRYHEKYLHNIGLNYKGYRGPVLGKKAPNETRIVMLGSSPVFGYGLRYNQALPAQLEEFLNQACGKKVSVVNLGYNGEGAYAFYLNLADFLFLEYDYAIIYLGYTDLGIGNTTAYRHDDLVFRVFKYMPILPLIAQEKIMLIRSRGHLDEAYRARAITFAGGKGNQTAAQSVGKALDAYNEIEKVIARLKKQRFSEVDPEILREDKWYWYKHFVGKAIDLALRHKKKVVLIIPPFMDEKDKGMQNSLLAMLSAKYRFDKSIFLVNLGQTMTLDDKGLNADKFHFTAKGARVMAEIIAQESSPFICQ